MKQNKFHALRNTQGMTLIEIMIVLAIIAGLTAVIATNFSGTLEKSKIKTVKIQFSEISKAIQQYSLDCGSLPSTDAGLQALIKAPSSGCANWGPMPYLEKESMIRDPWDTEIIYERNSSSSFTLLSLGADKQEGGEGLDADISSDD